MDRRYFLQSLGIVAAALAADAHSLLGGDEKPRVAITMDDPNSYQSPMMKPVERDERIRTALKGAGLQAALFVCGQRVDNAAGRKLIKTWDSDGHIIANHSYSHWYLPSRKISVDDYCADIIRGEKMISRYDNFTRLFRFPFLKEGDTTEKRDIVREFLRARGYRNGYVTIDASDWYYSQRLEAALKKIPSVDLNAYREVYCAHIWDRASYYHELTLEVLGHDIPHTLLIHHNLLNALFLGDLLTMFKTKGWDLINAAEAYADPIFASEPNIVPAGESLVWALAKETGRSEARLRYPAEDSVYEEEGLDKRGL